MSLRILFADDSMTAQNMGKKILSEAGYDVVAVSNGAAAVKKIAEQKPDIIILDVYMPGYSGLEVCEKVRGSLDTLKTPVLLTVGKMEPYKPEDANRVKADGVIIKPFEASDLLAIVKKFEERIGNMPPPLAKPAVVERSYEEEEAAPPEMPVEPPSSRASAQPMVEVPDHMAGSAAFGDLLGNEPAGTASPSHFAVNTPSAAFETSVIVPAPPVPVSDYEIAAAPAQEAPAAVEPVSENPVSAAPPADEIHVSHAPADEIHVSSAAPPVPEVPVSAVQEEPIVATPVEPEAVAPEIDAAPEVMVTPVESAPEPVQSAPEPVQSAPEPGPEVAPEPPAPEAVSVTPEPVAEAPHPHFIPVFKEPEPPAEEYAFIPTSAPPVDVEIPREPALQETAEETTRSTKAEMIEPGLLSTIGQQVESLPSPVVATQEISPSPVEAEPDALAAGDAAPEVSDADFEARVAAAMAAYNHAAETEIPAPPAHAGAEHGGLPATDLYAMHETTEAAHHAAAEVPSFEYHPPVRDEAPAVVESAPEPVAAQESHSVEAAAVAGVEAAIPEAAAAAAADSGADHHSIAEAVHRAMERLKPNLVEEIMRELKSKK